MCTVIVSIEPASAVPVLLAGVRDEFLARPWLPPAAHWPDHPGVLGGLDVQAGGTWLAVDPATRTVSCILNGFGPHAPAGRRLSRGALPLRLASPEGLQLSRYDPFHLILGTAFGVHLWSWNGIELSGRELGAGLHVVVNSGLEGSEPAAAPEQAVVDMAARLKHFRPRLAAARRPAPVAGSTETAWGDWLPLVTGDGLDLHAPGALVVRREFGAGNLWGTSSISLVGLRPDGIRYDFSPAPAVNWTAVA